MGRIALTGSSGLVAAGVIDYVLEKTQHNLILIDVKPPTVVIESPRLRYVTANLVDPAVWADLLAGADALIHLAAWAQPTHVGPIATHNTNVVLSYNALCAAAAAGIKRVVMAGSINAIGGAWNPDTPRFDYFPVDEKHPPYPVEGYSLSKYIGECQADAMARTYPDMSIATLRFHYVNPPERRPQLDWQNPKKAKDLWGWTNSSAAARACLLGLEMGDDREHQRGDGQEGVKLAGLKGHEVFFIVDTTHCCEGHSAKELAQLHFPSTEMRKEFAPMEGFYDVTKAKELLGWEHDGGLEPLANW